MRAGRRQDRLGPVPRPEVGQLAHGQTDHEQQQHRGEVLTIVHAQREVRLGVEEVVGERGRQRGEGAGQPTAERRRGDDDHDENERHVRIAEGISERDERSGDDDGGEHTAGGHAEPVIAGDLGHGFIVPPEQSAGQHLTRP